MKNIFLAFVLVSLCLTSFSQEKQKHTKRNSEGILIEEGYYLKNKKTDQWTFYYGNALFV